MAKYMRQNRDRLIELDSFAGDGDLGLALNDGFDALLPMLEQNTETDIGKLLYFIGKNYNAAAPSSAGTLISAGIIKAAKELRGNEQIDEKGIAVMIRSMMDGVMELGGAKIGEKTIVDGLAPAVEVLEKEIGNQDFKTVIKKASEASTAGSEATADMMAVHGRAAIRGKDSIGMIDGGAVAVSIIVKGIADYISIEME
jgi:dihydroxyacetone kinase-like protein